MFKWDQTEPFGDVPPNANPSGLGIFDMPLRSPGQYADSETGLFYNYFRDYDTATGRYLTSDPIGLVGGLNTYLYVYANPLKHVDALGLAVGEKPGGGTYSKDPEAWGTPELKQPPGPMTPPSCPWWVQKLFGGCTCTELSNNPVACSACCKTWRGYYTQGSGCQNACDRKYNPNSETFARPQKPVTVCMGVGP